MRTIFVLLIAVIFSLNAAGQLKELPRQVVPEEYGYKVNIGQQMPDISMQLVDGTALKTADLSGKVVMFQFTASWCSVCRKEMPHIEKDIWQKHKNNPDFVLVGIDMDEPLEKVIKFQKDIGTTYPLALDPGAAIFYTFAQQGAGVTRNIIFDKSGKIVYMTRLFKEDEFNEMVKVIDFLLAPSAKP